jgi:hypothetical protein
MASFLKFFGNEFLTILNIQLAKRVRACVIAIANRAKLLLSVPGTGFAIRKIGIKYPIFKRGTVYGFAPSKPGEPPRKQYGFLRKSVAFEVVQTPAGPIGRAGTDIRYGRVLEQGFTEIRSQAFGRPTRMYRWTVLARPWLRRAVKEMTPYMRVVMSRPIRL